MQKIQLIKLKLVAQATNTEADWNAYNEALEQFEQENPDLAEKKMPLLEQTTVSLEVQMFLEKIEESATLIAELQALNTELTAKNLELEEQNQKLQKQLKEEISKKETAKAKGKLKDEPVNQETPQEPEPNPATQE